MKIRIVTVLALVALSAAGVPIGSWLFVAAIASFAVGGLATILTAERIAQPAFAWGAALLIAGIAVSAAGAGLHVPLERPEVQLALAAVFGLLVLLGVAALAVKIWGVEPSKQKIPKFPVRDRALLVDPICSPVSASQSGTKARAPATAVTRAGSTSSATDELGIFRRRAP